MKPLKARRGMKEEEGKEDGSEHVPTFCTFFGRGYYLKQKREIILLSFFLLKKLPFCIHFFVQDARVCAFPELFSSPSPNLSQTTFFPHSVASAQCLTNLREERRKKEEGTYGGRKKKKVLPEMMKKKFFSYFCFPSPPHPLPLPPCRFSCLISHYSLVWT